MIEIHGGNEFVESVSSTLARKLKFEKWVSILYDASIRAGTSDTEDHMEARPGNKEGSDHTFKQLAFESKTFQKLSRISTSRVTDDNTKEKVNAEIEDSLKRFTDILGDVVDNLDKHDKENFKKEFLNPTKDQLANLLGLLDDFSTIKDYYLARRDEGGSR